MPVPFEVGFNSRPFVPCKTHLLAPTVKDVSHFVRTLFLNSKHLKMSNPKRIKEKNAAKTPAQHVLNLLPHFACNRSNSDSVESCKFSSLHYMVSCNAETRILTWSTEHFCGSSCQFVFMGALVLWQLLLIDDYLSWIAPQLKVNFNFKPSSTSPCGFPIPNARPNHAPFVNFICNVERLVPQRRWFFFFLALNLKSILKKNYSLNFCEFNHLMWNICL
jgi:hypothetical protein